MLPRLRHHALVGQPEQLSVETENGTNHQSVAAFLRPESKTFLSWTPATLWVQAHDARTSRRGRKRASNYICFEIGSPHRTCRLDACAILTVNLPLQ
jgi:hypothetical protein